MTDIEKLEIPETEIFLFKLVSGDEVITKATPMRANWSNTSVTEPTHYTHTMNDPMQYRVSTHPQTGEPVAILSAWIPMASNSENSVTINATHVIAKVRVGTTVKKYYNENVAKVHEQMTETPQSTKAAEEVSVSKTLY